MVGFIFTTTTTTTTKLLVVGSARAEEKIMKPQEHLQRRLVGATHLKVEVRPRMRKRENWTKLTCKMNNNIRWPANITQLFVVVVVVFSLYARDFNFLLSFFSSCRSNFICRPAARR